MVKRLQRFFHPQTALQTTSDQQLAAARSGGVSRRPSEASDCFANPSCRTGSDQSRFLGRRPASVRRWPPRCGGRVERVDEAEAARPGAPVRRLRPGGRGVPGRSRRPERRARRFHVGHGRGPAHPPLRVSTQRQAAPRTAVYAGSLTVARCRTRARRYRSSGTHGGGRASTSRAWLAGARTASRLPTRPG